MDGLFRKFYELPHLFCAIGAGDVVDCFCAVCDSVHDLICMSDDWSRDVFVTELIVFETRSLLVALMWHLCVR